MLDTNVCIAVMRGHPKALARLTSLAPGDCAVSSVVAYELYTGVGKAQQPERERSKVHRLLSVVQVLAFDEAAAENAAEVRAVLEKTGRICGPYDLLLAGHARSLGLIFATNNRQEFSRVGGLVVEDWLT